MNTLSLLQQLIAIKSITDSHDESLPIEGIKAVLQKHDISFITMGKGSKKNLVARIGKGEKIVILNSHFDVVPSEEKAFVPYIEKDILYGRGAADAKGSLVAMLAAFVALKKQQLHGQIIFCAVCDEENAGEKGTKLLVDNGIIGKFHLIGEPTDNIVVIAEKGFLRLSIKIFGKEQHAAFPRADMNAVQLASRVIQAIESLQFSGQHKVLSPLTISFGLISGGKKINIGAGECIIGVDIRYLPNQSEEEILQKIRNILNPICSYDIQRISHGIPFTTSAGSQLVQVAQKVTGSQLVGVNFTTDGRYYEGKEVIVLGPGKSEMAHQPNEHVTVKDVLRTVDVYKNIVIQCLEES